MLADWVAASNWRATDYPMIPAPQLPVQRIPQPTQSLTQKELLQQMPTFSQAFKAAREAGLKVFEWRGKKYNTNLKEEEDAMKKSKKEQSPMTSRKSITPPISQKINIKR